MFKGVQKLLPTLKTLLKFPAKKSYFATNATGHKPRVFRSKGKGLRPVTTKLAIVIVSVGFLLNYQPAPFSFPPIRQAVVKADFEQTQTLTPTPVDIEFKLPHSGYVSTYFSNFHPGVDIASGLGMPVHPIAKGKVTSSGLNFWGLGLVVEIDHEHGYKSLYAHLGKIYAKSGQEVSPEDIIGEVGLTGQTSGPHTHLELNKDGKNFDPLFVLPKLPNIAVAWNSSGVASGSAQLTKTNLTPQSLPQAIPPAHSSDQTVPVPDLSTALINFSTVEEPRHNELLAHLY